MAAEYLEFLGAQVRTAHNGEEGLLLLDVFKPNIILLDLSMPKMDGWQMFEAIQTRNDIAGIPVIALTAHAMPEDREKALGVGFDGYITKPFLLTTLQDEISQWINNDIQGNINVAEVDE